MIAEPPTPEQTEKLRKLRRLKELRKHNGLAAYEPHEKQAKFHAAGEFKLRYLRTGNRFGKSTCGAAEDCAWAVGARLWLPKGHPDRQAGIPMRPTKGLILVADWDKAREIFTNQVDGAAGRGKLYKFLPTASLKEPPHKNQAGEVDCIPVESIWGGTSLIYIDTVKSFMSNPMGQESSAWDWIHVDEPCPKPMWIANSRGLIDADGSAWFTCTPIEHQWINEMFVPQSMIRLDFEDGAGNLIKPSKDNPAPSSWIMTGSSYDNTSISKAGIDRFVASLTPEERAARLHGRPRAYAGVVYSEVDRSIHEYYDCPIGWKDHSTPPDNYTIRVSIDPHPKTPHAVLFAATAPTGQTFFYREYFEHTLIDGLCDAILEILANRTPHIVLCDPSAFVADPISGATWADTFWRRGVNVVPAPKELTFGIVATKQALSERINGQASLLFSSALSRTWFEFDSYIWDPKKENKPLDKNDHTMECLYRLVITGLDYVDPGSDAAVNLGYVPFEANLRDFSSAHKFDIAV